jgi:hypothetical protein
MTSKKNGPIDLRSVICTIKIMPFGAEGVVQVIECLPCNYKALSSNTNTTKNK